MDELIKVTQKDGQSVVSARDLHEFLEIKNHFTQWFDDNKNQFDEGIDYQAIKVYVSHENGTGGTNKVDYAISLDCAKELAMMSRVEKGKFARKYFIECEKKLKGLILASYQIEDPIERANAWIEEQKKSKALLDLANSKIEQDRHKVAFAETVTGSSNSILIRQFAKDLCDGNFEIGQNRLFEWFRENKYLNDQNEPYQQHISLGLFEVITRAIGSGTETFTTKTTKITGKGQVYFTKKIKSK